MSNLEQALEECLTKLSSGEAKLEDCLAHYPEHANELRRLLATTDYIREGRAIQPAPVFKARTRAKVIAHVNANSRRPQAKRGPQFRRVFGKTFSFAFNLATILFLFLLTGSVLAQTASPGDRLYDWRLATEELWRTYHPNPINANLTLTERHAQDVLDIARSNNPALEELAIQDYQDALNELSTYAVPGSRDIISASLNEQKAHLAEAQLEVPALDQLLNEVNPKAHVALSQEIASVEGRQITYSFSITNQGPTSPISAILTTRLSPEQTWLGSTADDACRVTPEGLVECTIADLPAGTARNFTVTTAIDPCYVGPVTNTATIATAAGIVNTSPTQEVAVEHEVTWTFPGPSRIVYVQSDDRHHSLVGTITSGSASPLTANLQEWAGAPAWSPDGTKLVFFGEEGISQLGPPFNEGNGVWMMDIIDGQAQNPRLFVAEDHVKNIVWSPDGTKLAFEVGPPKLTHEIVVVDVRTGQPVGRFSGEEPAWSPDNTQLVMKACQPECGLWRVNLDGSGATRITFGDSDSYPAWSPTGQYLAFTSAREGNWEIYLLALADKQLIRLTNRPGTDTTPVFGSCGREIYLRTDHYGGWRITVMKLDGSDETTVIEGVGPTNEWGLARPAIYPF